MPQLSLSIDLFQATLLLCILLMVLASGVTLSMRSASTYLRLWNTGGLLVAIGMTLIIMRGEILESVSIVFGNLALIGGYTALALGTKRFLQRPAYFDVLLGLLFAVGFAVAYAAGANVVFRILIFSTFYTLNAASVFLGLRKTGKGGQHALIVRLALAVLPMTILMAVIRGTLAAGVLLGLPQPLALMKGLLGLAVLATLCLSVLLVFATMDAGARPAIDPEVAQVSEAQAPAAKESVTLREGPAVRGWQLVHARRTLVSPRGAEMKLTGNEYLLLKRLLDGGKGPIPRVVLNTIIGRDASNPKDRSVDILLSRLRRKCHEAGSSLPVQSVRGQGYVFHGEAAADGAQATGQ